MPEYDDDLRLALELADAADAATMERFRALDLKVETKPDMTPVSEADQAAEEIIRAGIAAARPGDAILGEEYGLQGSGPRRWVVDPIDGTKNYVRGVPVWATLISLMAEGADGAFRPVVGVVSAAGAGPPLVGGRGAGGVRGRCARRERRAHGDSRVPGGRAGRRLVRVLLAERLGGAGRLAGFLDLTRACWRTRGYGDFWPYMMVAEGSLDLCAEPQLNLWDMAAIAVVVQEAGGRFTSLDGVDGVHGGNAAASNGLLHEEMLGLLRPRT